MRAMRPTLLIPAGFQLAVIFLLTIVPFISANPSQPAGSSKCVGNPSEICDDSDGLDLHRSGISRQYKDPVIVQQFGWWYYLGCFPDSNKDRILKIPITGGINSVSYCLTACRLASDTYYYAGMEWGKECWCDIAMGGTDIKKLDEKSCNIACPGNDAQNCGGVHSILVYNYVGW